MSAYFPERGTEKQLAMTTRFAPSPTGLLHLGHAYSAMMAFTHAREAGGRFLLRIEDIDVERCHLEFEETIQRDLKWLGIHWQNGVVRQSERSKAYQQALAQLSERGVLYPCFCSRKEIQEELANLTSAPHQQHPIYPGTCRALSISEREKQLRSGRPYALRLDTETALKFLSREATSWKETDATIFQIDEFLHGDEIIARKDIGTSYHLAVVTDDAWQGVDLVIRGEDLRPSTAVQRILQGLLKIPLPSYLHHKLIADENGKRLAKRSDASSIANYRERGFQPLMIWNLLGLGDFAPETLRHS